MNSESRAYHSPLRNERARLTESRIIASADRLFVERGYQGTTIAAIATAAGVSAQTVYSGFDSKAALLRRVYDARVLGDDSDIPIDQRQVLVALDSETDIDRIFSAYTQLSRELAERISPLLPVVSAAAAGDRELAATLGFIDAKRLYGAVRVAGRLAALRALRPGLTAEEAGDRLWALSSVELWQSFTQGRGWSVADYDRWLTATLRAAVGR